MSNSVDFLGMVPFTLPIGAKAPSFILAGTDGRIHTLEEFAAAKGLVIFFTCNHCPYVQGSDPITAQLAERFRPQGIVFVAINSNSSETYQEDSFGYMIARMIEHRFPWAYLYDPLQEVALAYGALRTPHFYLFDRERRLIYTGRAIDTPKDPSRSTGNALEQAIVEYLAGKPISNPLTNPVGCNVKWSGKEKHWMPPEACDLV